MSHDLELDTNVRDWVFIPLTVSIVLMKLLTQFAHMVRIDRPIILRCSLYTLYLQCPWWTMLYSQLT